MNGKQGKGSHLLFFCTCKNFLWSWHI